MDIAGNKLFLGTQIWEQLVLSGRVRTASQRSCQRAGLGQRSSTWTPEHRMAQGHSKKHQCLTPPQTNWIHAVDTHAWALAHVEALQEIWLDSHGWEYWSWVLWHEGAKLNYKRQHMPVKTFSSSIMAVGRIHWWIWSWWVKQYSHGFIFPRFPRYCCGPS